MILNPPPQPTLFYGTWFADNVPAPISDSNGWKFKLDGSDWSIISGIFLYAVGRVEGLIALKIIGDVCLYGGISCSYVRKRKAERKAKNPFSKNIDWHYALDGSDSAILVGVVILMFTRGYAPHLECIGYILLCGGILRSFVLKRIAETVAESTLNTRCTQVRTIIIPPSPVHHPQYPQQPVRNQQDSLVRPFTPSPEAPYKPPTPNAISSSPLDAPFGKVRKAMPRLLPPMMGIHSSVGSKEPTKPY